MPHYDWQGLMTEWNTALLNNKKKRPFLPSDAVANKWLGYPGATEAQIIAVEKRLNTQLPRSYREFLRFSNGWQHIGSFVYNLWSVEEIEWLSVRHQKWIDIRANDPYDVPDEEYLVYGQDQPDGMVRAYYLKTALEISDKANSDSAVLLLNPKIVDSEGEWEAWFFASWSLGPRRYRSFWEMMVYTYQNYLDLREKNDKLI